MKQATRDKEGIYNTLGAKWKKNMVKRSNNQTDDDQDPHPTFLVVFLQGSYVERKMPIGSEHKNKLTMATNNMASKRRTQYDVAVGSRHRIRQKMRKNKTHPPVLTHFWLDRYRTGKNKKPTISKTNTRATRTKTVTNNSKKTINT